MVNDPLGVLRELTGIFGWHLLAISLSNLDKLKGAASLESYKNSL